LNRILGRPALTVDFDAGLVIERTVHALEPRGAVDNSGLMAIILRLPPAQRPIRQPNRP
jgi:hypothetical protein